FSAPPHDLDLHSFPTRRSSDLAPVLVNVHLNRLQSDGRRAALPSPREIHVDGEPFTFVVLVERTPNLVGGISYVADRCCAGKLVDRKSTRLNSSHQIISYAVFC